MKIAYAITRFFFKYRLKKIEKMGKNPMETQGKVLRGLIRKAKNTEWGKLYKYESISSIAEFQKNVPVSSYEDIFPFISRMMEGEKNILWPGLIPYFSKSSGTTETRSKFIPVSKNSLKDCNFRAGKDEIVFYIKNNPEAKIFKGKNLVVAGSLNKIKDSPKIFCGDVSAIITKNLPFWAEYFRTPSLETALLVDYEEKIERLAEESSKENVVSLAGVPTWVSLLIKKVLEKKKVKNIFEVWPNLEVFFHGAVSFSPYQKLFEELLPSSKMNYMENYNASEGFFAIQDDLSKKGEMMLMLDYGVFYEFVLAEDLNSKDSKFLTIDQVEIGENYAIVISTNAGLWRYAIGDTVSFTSLYPHRIKITGRTKHFINAFGEEVIIDNADNAITEACFVTDSLISEYTAAPIFMGDGKKGAHEWIIEFEKKPESIDKFRDVLDLTLRKINSDYDTRRFKDVIIGAPIITVVPSGTFYKWMKSRKKLGGQNKVPRLSNTREYVDEILRLIK